MTGRFPSATSPDFEIAEAAQLGRSPVDPTPTIDLRADLEPPVPREPVSFGSSSLSGSAEGRYYREVARVCTQVADALEYRSTQARVTFTATSSPPTSCSTTRATSG